MRWSHVWRGSMALGSRRRGGPLSARSLAAVEALEYRRLLTAAPVAVYHFDEGAGNATSDANGGNHGTLAGDSEPTWAAGKVGSAALTFHGDGSYKGTGSRVDVSNSLNAVLGGTASLAAWIKTEQVGSETFWMSPSITGSEHLGDGNDVFWGNLGHDGTISVRRGDGPAAASTTAINDGQWHHVAFTRDAASGEQKAYVDGMLEGEAIGVAGIAGTEFFAIGATTDVSFTGDFIEGYNYFDGDLDEVTIADRVWSDDEVAAIFAGATVPAPDGGPSDLEVAATGPFSVTLNWQNHSTNEAGFEIERSLSGAEGTFFSVGGAPAGATSATDVTARPATQYFYRVRAVTLGGASDPTNVVGATTAEDPITRGPDGFGYAATFGTISDPGISPGEDGVETILQGYDFGYTAVDLRNNTFDFYGRTYSGANALYVNTNGLITFDNANPWAGPGGNLAFDPYQASIAVLWDFWTTQYGADASVLTKFVDADQDGKAEQLVVEWHMVQHLIYGSGTVTFQAVLELNTDGAPGDITLNYSDIDTDSGFPEGSTATAGMKDYGWQAEPGANRLLFSWLGDTGLVGTGKSIRVQWSPYPNDAAPIADAGGPYTIGAGAYRRLDGSGSHDPDQFLPPLRYQWDLDGDGVFGEVYPNADRGDESIVDPFFTTAGLAAGTAFPVALRVVDRRGKVSAISHGVVNVVENQPPTARAGGPYSVTAGGTVVLDASATTDPDEDAGSLRYEWDFDGDDTYGFGSQYGYEIGQTTPFYAYGLTSPGTFTARLRVTDAAGNQSFAQADITILPNQPPTAIIAGPNSVAVGNSIVINGVSSFDPDDPYGLTYLWDLNHNGIYGEGYTDQGYEGGDFVVFSAYYLSPGTWTVGLRVIDPAGNDDTTTVDITIVPNGAPVANAGGPYTVLEGRDIILDPSGSIDPEGDPLQILWDSDNDGEYDSFGDRLAFSALNLAGGTTATVGLRVRDSAGNTSDTTATINVVDAAPVLHRMQLTRSLKEGESAGLMGSVFDTTADEHTATIDWGDGTVETLPAPAGNFLYEHLYADDGHYSVKLTVSDADGSDSTVVSDRMLNVLWVGFNPMSSTQSLNVTPIHPLQLFDWPFAGYDVIYVDSSNYLFNYAPARAQDFADFVSAGGGLVVEGGGSREEPDFSWVPKHDQLAWEADFFNDAAVITPAGSHHRVTSNLSNAHLFNRFGFHTIHFTASGDLEVLTTTPAGSPNTLVGSFGLGRVVYTGILASGMMSQSHRDLAHQATWWAGGNNGPDAVTSIDVENVAPVITATGVESAFEGDSYTLNLSSSDPGDDTIDQWTIDWGDGTVQTVPGHPSSVTHAYGDDGNYAIRASAADEDGTYSTFAAPRWPAADGGNGHYYLLTSDHLSWEQAEAEAVALGGHLVSMTSQEEQNFVVNNFLLTGNPFNIYWIGMTDAGDQEGNFHWTTGEDVTYVNWIPWEPDDVGGIEDYAAINWYFGHNFGGFGMWSDVGPLGSPWYGDFNGFTGIIELESPPPSQRVTVHNAAPAMNGISSPASVIGGASPGVAVNLSATFADPGLLDTHSAVIDWGDGATTDGTLSEANGAGAFSGAHAYASGGVYTATLILTDDDGGVSTNSITLYVSGSGVHRGVVQVVGTAAADKLKVERLANGTYLVTDEARGTATRLAAEPGVPIASVMVLLGGGDDKVNLTGSVTVPALVDGGAGNDTLNGSNAGNIVIGGAGDDAITGGSGRDLLIAGLGADRVVGNGGDDILIGGYTAYDADYASLWQVMAEWTRNTSYASRVSNLKNGSGLNEEVVFDGSTVFDDRATDALTSDAVDVLTGGSGDDWFLSNFAGGGKLDNITDFKAGEARTDLA